MFTFYIDIYIYIHIDWFDHFVDGLFANFKILILLRVCAGCKPHFSRFHHSGCSGHGLSALASPGAGAEGLVTDEVPFCHLCAKRSGNAGMIR